MDYGHLSTLPTRHGRPELTLAYETSEQHQATQHQQHDDRGSNSPAVSSFSLIKNSRVAPDRMQYAPCIQPSPAFQIICKDSGLFHL